MITDPRQIEVTSMEIIEQALTEGSFDEVEKRIAKRMIHTTGDTEYQSIIVFQHDFVKAAKEALLRRAAIYVDTNMIRAGINKPALEKIGSSLHCYVGHEEVWAKAQEEGTTRSACAIDKGIAEGAEIFVIGNAPTALFRLLQRMEEGVVRPKCIIGVPVGFVGAAESKEALRNTAIAAVSTVGTKGGSNVAASIVNALLYELGGRDA